MKENAVKDKSFQFAIRIVKIYEHLTGVKKEYVLSKQLLRSGTSVGAMVREAQHAESKADFKHKLAIAQKEINESLYWLELMKETDYLREVEFKSIHSDATEVLKLLTSILKTTKSN
ncbi:MAG: four helix bundle protein [Bacteroidia bacterium]|jgi:four helix bundle protein|tara:strand:- start:62 stop:412 length:351 start_codon:yes stop_codon:yes gene_type:complete